MIETVIVGGGPAGASAAIALARAGQRPLLLERDAIVGEKVCGEFLADDAARTLESLGVRLASLGAARIARAIFAAGRYSAELPLPFAAWSLPRARLDATLLEAARAAGAQIATGVAVRQARRGAAGWQVSLAANENPPSRNLILATGKHELRGVRRAARGDAIGVKLLLAGQPPEAAVTLLLCAGGYAGLQPRPDGGANLCAALDPRAPGVAEAARTSERFLAHVAAGSKLGEALLSRLVPAMSRPMTIAGVPYGFIHWGDGPFRVGDQAAVIPSFCGAGVAMALRSGLRAAEAVLAGRGAVAHHAVIRRDNAAGMRVAAALAAVMRHTPRTMVSGIACAPSLAALLARGTRVRSGRWHGRG
jgi:flavin-dependent dehydrogenase